MTQIPLDFAEHCRCEVPAGRESWWEDDHAVYVELGAFSVDYRWPWLEQIDLEMSQSFHTCMP